LADQNKTQPTVLQFRIPVLPAQEAELERRLMEFVSQATAQSDSGSLLVFGPPTIERDSLREDERESLAHAGVLADGLPAEVYTVQVGCTVAQGCVVKVRATSPEEACRKALAEEIDSWKLLDSVCPSYIDVIARGDVDPWNAKEADTVEIPTGFTQPAVEANGNIPPEGTGTWTWGSGISGMDIKGTSSVVLDTVSKALVERLIEDDSLAVVSPDGRNYALTLTLGLRAT
jgi:hypothetical protein